jgi:hypothetical protein
MSEIRKLEPPKLKGLTITVGSPNAVSMAGVLSVPDPRQTVGAYFESLHAAALADKVGSVELDVRELTFVNSSAIRLFVDWATRISALPDEQRYRVHFLTSRHVSWQRTSFHVLQTIAPRAVEVTSD